MRIRWIVAALSLFGNPASAMKAMLTDALTKELRQITAADPVLLDWSADGKPAYVRIDGKVYPVVGTQPFEFYPGIVLHDGAQLDNCHRANNLSLTHSSMVFVGNGGSGYIYVAAAHFKPYAQFKVFDLKTPDGNVVCDGPLVPDPTDSIFMANFDKANDSIFKNGFE